MTTNLDLDLWPMVSLKDALGERRFRAWNLAQEQKNFNPDESANLSDTNLNLDGKDNSLDLTKLLSTAASDVDADLTSSAHHAGNVPDNRSSDAKDRDAVVSSLCFESVVFTLSCNNVFYWRHTFSYLPDLTTAKFNPFPTI